MYFSEYTNSLLEAVNSYYNWNLTKNGQTSLINGTDLFATILDLASELSISPEQPEIIRERETQYFRKKFFKKSFLFKSES
ncbi:hypothetical protein N9584_00865 [Flavobacteriaceae bacterium]|nr:hypothetical protein [Flavobacteriaceae bacterium]